MSIFSKIKDWLTGDSSKKSSTKKAKTASNYGGGGSRSVRDSYGTRVKEKYRDRDDEERRRQQEAKRRQQERTDALKQISQRTDALSSGKTTSSVTGMKTIGSGRSRAVAKIQERTKSQPTNLKQEQAQKAKDDVTKQLKQIEKRMPTVKSDRERIASGDYEYSPVAKNANTPSAGDRPSLRLTPKGFEKQMENEAFRKSLSASRGIAGGTSLGVGKLLLSGDKNDPYQRAMEEVYQRNKSKGWETAGEFAGSLVGFGGTAKATETLGAKAVNKIAPNAAEKLAETGIVKGLSKYSVNNAVRKGIANEATEELIKRVGRDRATKILNALGTEAVQNLTTGAVYDIANATANHEFLSDDWWRELGESARFNLGSTSVIGAFSALGGGRRLVGEAVEQLGKQIAPDIGEAAIRNAPEVAGEMLGRQADDVVMDAVEPQTRAVNLGAVEEPPRVAPEPPRVETERPAVEPEPPKAKPKGVDVDALTKERNANNAEIEQLRKNIRNDYANMTPEERDAMNEMKARFKKLVERNDTINKQLAEHRTSTAKPIRSDAPREDREAERDFLKKEYSKLREEVREAEKKLERGEKVNVDVLEANKERMDELGSQISKIEREIGTKATPRKVRSDAGVKKTTATQVDEEMPRTDVTDSVKEAEPEPTKTATETLEEGEVKPEANAKPTETAEPDAEAKPTETAKPEVEAEAKPKPPKEKQSRRKKSEAAKKLARDTELENQHAEYKRNVKSETEGEYAANKTTVGIGKASSAQNERKIISELKRANETMRAGGDVDLKHAHVVRGADYESGLAKKSLERVTNDRGAVEKRLKSLYKEVKNADKIGETKNISLEDLSDIYAVINSYEMQGKKVPAKLFDTLEQLQELHGTQYGQGLKMIHIMRMNRSTEYRKAFANRDLKAYVKRFGIDDIESISKSMKAKTGKSLEDRIDDWAKAKDISREEQEKAYAALQIDIFRHTEPSIMDTINLWRHMFLLSKPTTALNNILGNTLMYTMSGINDRTRYFAEKALKAKHGDKIEMTTTLTKNINSDGRKLMGWRAKSGDYKDKAFAERINGVVEKAVNDIMGDHKWETNLEKGLDFDYAKDIRAQLKGGATKLGAKGNKAVGMMLNKPDEWFVEKNYRSALIKYLYANGIDSAEKLAGNPDLLRRAEDFASKAAKENTFKSASQLVNILDKFRQAGYKKNSPVYKKILSMVVDANIPFAKVPWNLVKVNTKYSPIGAVWNGAQAMKAAKNGDVEALQQAVGEMSKGLTGTGLATLGFFLNCDDATDDDSFGFIAKADKALKEYNVRDYSFKIGNKNLNLANTGIGTIQFLIGAQYADWVNEQGGLPKALKDDPTAIVTSLAMTFAPISDMSLLDNLVDSAKSFTYGSQNDDWNIVTGLGNVLEQSAGNYAGQFVPSPLRAVARGTTSADLDTGVKKGASNTQRVANNLVSGVPYFNEKALPHRTDTHGNLINEKKSTKDKLIGEGGVIQNLTDPFSTRTINIPKADKVELNVEKKGKPYKPLAFDSKRTYQAKIGMGQNAEYIDLTGKEREQASRSYKNSGHDMVDNVIRRGWFGDTHGERAAELIKSVPEDEEKAREILYNTPEFKALSNDDKVKFMDDLYDSRQGRGRTANHEVYVNIEGNDEGDFRFQNDLRFNYQNKYKDKGLEELGISKGQYADIIEAAKYESHKFKDGKNVDTIQAYGLKKALLENPDLTREQRIALYQAERGKRNGFGWYDWNGVSLKGGYRRRGFRRWHRWGHGGSSGKATVPKPKKLKESDFIKGEALVSKSKSSSKKKAPLPKLKRVELKTDLPNARK